MSLLFRVAILAALALALSACSASADIGAPATPQPAPTPQPPQVIVIQSPPATQPTPPAIDGSFLLVILAFVACLIAGSGACGFLIARITSQSASSAPQPYSQAQPGLYSIELTYEEAAVIAQWRERQKRITRDEAMRYIGEVRR